MHLSLAFAALVAVGPAFANASPPGNGIVIPLSKRAVQVKDVNGVVNSQALRSLATRTGRKLGRAFLAYERGMGKAHPFAMRASTDVWGRDDRSGVEPLTEDQNELWHGTILVGTPPVNFTVDIDSASSQVFLPGTLCAKCQGHKIYDTAASSTAEDLDSPFTFGFNDGSSIKGEVFTDTVTMAGLTATNQSIGVASEYPTDNFRADGLMGMGLSEHSIFNTSTFFDNLFVQGAVLVPQFSLKLAANGSELFLGGSNSSLFTGEFTTVNVTQPGFHWQLNLDAVNAGSNQTVIGAQAVIDIGAAVILAPESDVVKLYQAIPGSKDAANTIGPGIFTFPCNTDPQISLTFGGKGFPISLSSFNVGQTTPGSTDCIGAIMGTRGINFWVVGGTFLENYYTRFDSGAKQVGFATLA